VSNVQSLVLRAINFLSGLSLNADPGSLGLDGAEVVMGAR